MITKLLIANRGEIACRIIETARRMGIATVAVYSTADRAARHVRLADEAVPIGGSAPADSYLQADRIIEAARRSGADAIHPGYGFLSENPEFAAAVAEAGLIFVGPSAEAIRTMGLKDRAKAVMERAGVPIVPGYHGADQDAARLQDEAERIGYPVLIKAVAGGGGKGMRVVEDAGGFAQALSSARAEARTAFDNDAVLIERFVTSPRHIELQIFGDGTDAIHLFERDCSLQRRHQKVIEEAPAPGMTEAVRAAMGQAAVKAARAIGYSGAGTVEFIADGSGPLRADGFWFMEMNTRLQVEHPVTEAITGVDLVEWQLRVAGGAPLPMGQDDLSIDGHAFEARLYAEDPANGFLPATGALSHLGFPEGVRVDTGVEAGDRVTPFYDPMIAKLIVHGPDRATALDRLRDALARTRIAGTVTNLGFLHALTCDDDFSRGGVDTGLIARKIEALTAAPTPSPRDLALAAVLLSGIGARDHRGFSLHKPLRWRVDLGCAEVTLTPRRDGTIACATKDATVIATDQGGTWLFDGARARPCHLSDRTVTLFGPDPLTLSRPDPLDRVGTTDKARAVTAPMPGLLREVVVAVGDSVAAGDRLAVLEAMKMEHVLRAPRAGVIATVGPRAGDQVQGGVTLFTLEDPKE